MSDPGLETLEARYNCLQSPCPCPGTTGARCARPVLSGWRVLNHLISQ